MLIRAMAVKNKQTNSTNWRGQSVSTGLAMREFLGNFLLKLYELITFGNVSNDISVLTSKIHKSHFPVLHATFISWRWVKCALHSFLMFGYMNKVAVENTCHSNVPQLLNKEEKDNSVCNNLPLPTSPPITSKFYMHQFSMTYSWLRAVLRSLSAKTDSTKTLSMSSVNPLTDLRSPLRLRAISALCQGLIIQTRAISSQGGKINK